MSSGAVPKISVYFHSNGEKWESKASLCYQTVLKLRKWCKVVWFYKAALQEFNTESKSIMKTMNNIFYDAKKSYNRLRKIYVQIYKMFRILSSVAAWKKYHSGWFSLYAKVLYVLPFFSFAMYSHWHHFIVLFVFFSNSFGTGSWGHIVILNYIPIKFYS